MVFERLRIPAIVGLLISGALIGPNGFNLLSPDLEFSILGTIGLQYLMFLAGLEIDLIDFIGNKKKSIFFGVVSFTLPFLLGYVICFYILGFGIIASLLISSMLSSHTLISYPIISRMGIVTWPIITILIGGTIIADVLALMSMEVITEVGGSYFHINHLLQLIINFLLLFGFIFLIIPKITRWFFNYYDGDLNMQYIFVLAVLFLCTVVAELLDIEPIIGAFFCGIILNKFVIRSSALFKRIEFIGNSLFIPIFLISVGILANFAVYFADPYLIITLVALIITALAGKYLAVKISSLTFKFSGVENNLIFGLSVSRAASAIAIILIGFNLGVLDEIMINHTVILILVTSIISSYFTQNSAREIVVSEKNQTMKKEDKEVILVPVANPDNISNLLDFSLLVKNADNNVPIYPLSVFTGKDQSQKDIGKSKERIQKAVDMLHSDTKFEIASRLDTTVTNGISRASKELMSSVMVIGWNEKSTTIEVLFGTILKKLLKKTDKMIFVVKTPTSSLHNMQNLYLFAPEFAQHETGFVRWVDKIILLTQQFKCKATILANEQTLMSIKAVVSGTGKKYIGKTHILDHQNPESVMIKPGQNDLLVFVNSRKGSISYDKNYDKMVNKLSKRYCSFNLLYIYPEQN